MDTVKQKDQKFKTDGQLYYESLILAQDERWRRA